MSIALDINIENRAKELSKEVLKSIVYENIDKDLVKKLSKEVAKEAVFEILNKGKDRRFRNTKLLMLNYNKLKQHILNEKDEIKIIYDCMDEYDIRVEYMWLESILKSKGKTVQMLKYVDEQLIYLENKYRENKQFEKYQAFKMLIVENKTIIEIQKELGCGKNSPNNWSNEIIKELSVLLWGIDALDM